MYFDPLAVTSWLKQHLKIIIQGLHDKFEQWTLFFGLFPKILPFLDTAQLKQTLH